MSVFITLKEWLIEPEKESKIGLCVECYKKEGDSSTKKVFHCELCDKWFCAKHIEPKFPYFVDWDSVFDVQGDREIKLMFYTEYQREEGHPDFVYWRKKVEALAIEEKTRNELIRQAIDRMMHVDETKTPLDLEEERKRTVRKVQDDEQFYEEEARKRTVKKLQEEKEIHKLIPEGAETVETRHGFVVPREVYSNSEYRSYLDQADNVKSIKVIVEEFYRKYSKKKDLEEPSVRAEEPQRKKHWWQ
jgi:ribosomal protein L17